MREENILPLSSASTSLFGDIGDGLHKHFFCLVSRGHWRTLQEEGASGFGFLVFSARLSADPQGAASQRLNPGDLTSNNCKFQKENRESCRSGK